MNIGGRAPYRLSMTTTPRLRAPDSTVSLLRDPYHWVGGQMRSHGRPLFEARILGELTVFISGAHAAEIFYSGGRFTRQGAVPKPVLWLLQDEGSVVVLDGLEHQLRKALFLALMTPER